MKEIDRYSLEEDDLAPNEHGPWVKHSDYAEDRKVLMDALKKYEDVRDGYGNYSARALLAGLKEADWRDKRIAELEAQLAALDWRLADKENPPVAGQVVFARTKRGFVIGAHIVSDLYDPEDSDFEFLDHWVITPPTSRPA